MLLLMLTQISHYTKAAATEANLKRDKTKDIWKILPMAPKL